VVKSLLPFRTNMTSEIVQSDIDLTRRMIELRRPDCEIIAILGKRGIDADRAALLLDDLRYGRKVVPHLPLGYHIIPRGSAAREIAESVCVEARAEVGKMATVRTGSAVQTFEEGDDPENSPAFAGELQLVEALDEGPRRMAALKWVALALALVTLGIAVWILRSRTG
jgi:hypothetical protein